MLISVIQIRQSLQGVLEGLILALNAMQAACLPAKAFAYILQRLHNQALGDEGVVETTKPKTDNKSKSAKIKPKPTKADPVSEMLASHPDAQTRIQPFLAAEQDCN